MTHFDPEAFSFVRLLDFQIPGGVNVYEYRNHALVDGRADVLRINTYLSKDGSYVTIWNGLIEPAMTEGLFELPESMQDLRFQDLHCEHLFRGYIERDEEATTILNALRLKVGRYSVPQVLTGAPHELRCEPLGGTEVVPVV